MAFRVVKRLNEEISWLLTSAGSYYGSGVSWAKMRIYMPDGRVLEESDFPKIDRLEDDNGFCIFEYSEFPVDLLKSATKVEYEAGASPGGRYKFEGSGIEFVEWLEEIRKRYRSILWDVSLDEYQAFENGGRQRVTYCIYDPADCKWEYSEYLYFGSGCAGNDISPSLLYEGREATQTEWNEFKKYIWPSISKDYIPDITTLPNYGPKDSDMERETDNGIYDIGLER